MSTSEIEELANSNLDNLLLEPLAIVTEVSSSHAGKDFKQAVSDVFLETSAITTKKCNQTAMLSGDIFLFDGNDDQQRIYVQLNRTANIQVIGAVVAVNTDLDQYSVWDYISFRVSHQLSSGGNSAYHNFGTIGQAGDQIADISGSLQYRIASSSFGSHTGNMIEWDFGAGFGSTGSLVCGIFALGNFTDASDLSTGDEALTGAVAGGIVAVLLVIAAVGVYVFISARQRKKRGFYSVGEMMAARADQIVRKLNRGTRTRTTG